MRYVLQIRFKSPPCFDLFRTWDIYETFKTLKDCECMYTGLIDNTVYKAQITDTVTNKIIKQLIQ